MIVGGVVRWAGYVAVEPRYVDDLIVDGCTFPLIYADPVILLVFQTLPRFVIAPFVVNVGAPLLDVVTTPLFVDRCCCTTLLFTAGLRYRYVVAGVGDLVLVVGVPRPVVRWWGPDLPLLTFVVTVVGNYGDYDAHVDSS